LPLTVSKHSAFQKERHGPAQILIYLYHHFGYGIIGMRAGRGDRNQLKWCTRGMRTVLGWSCDTRVILVISR
jgi:hypothetical protein